MLIVEDNLVNQKVLQRMLIRLGYSATSVVTVDNGQLALDAVEERGKQHDAPHKQPTGAPHHPFPVVLMDVFMPVMGGLEATSAIRSSRVLPSYRQPFICALTANAMTGDREVCLQSGMNFYLSKPVTLDALRDALGRAWQHYGKQQAAEREGEHTTK